MSKVSVVKHAALAMAVAGILGGMGGAASAADNSAVESGVQPAVAWPFHTCYRQNYVKVIYKSYKWIFVYDHTDGPRLNYYRVVDSEGKQVGNGWASCAE